MRTARDRSPIHGRLGSVSLNDLIQLLAMTQRTATLVLTWKNERGRVYFRQGQIVHATAGDLEAEDGLLRLLEWSEADFAVQDGVDSLPRESIEVSTEALLLDALRRLDERRRSPPAGNDDGRGEASPPRPEKARARRYPTPRRRRARARWQWAGAAAGLLLVTVGLLLAVDVLSGAPWDRLPAHQSPPLPAPIPEPRALEAAASPPGDEPAETTSTSAPIANGYLTVIVEPWAFVSVDGRPVGETPLESIALGPGAHEVTLTNPSVVGSIRAQVVIASGENVVRRFSFNDVGYLLVLADPWADVEVDGRGVGQTPLSRITVPAGPHVVRFRHPELGARDRSAVVASGETVRLRVDLRTP